ncbi:hypothetical protein [Uliginosibacterium gangwonense]|uniref:hypothetical protein n=1 Tax=Uliginosibacterium gangwonense TaxID=392736 RepID=UPI0003A145BA|nr:hypothetical protein [Uliginosibacterium gangwonense]
MMQMEWDFTRHALLAGAMDDAHQVSIRLIRRLALAADADEPLCLEQLLLHCEEHFMQEKAWMDDSAMPLSERHLRDHAAIHAMLINARDELRAGKAGAGRKLGTELFALFDRHFATYDAALALCMLQKRHAAGPGIPAVG